MLECHCGKHLKKARMPGEFAILNQPFGGPLDNIVQQSKFVFRNLFPVGTDALIDAYKMWRGVQSSAQSRCLQDCGQRRSG